MHGAGTLRLRRSATCAEDIRDRPIGKMKQMCIAPTIRSTKTRNEPDTVDGRQARCPHVFVSLRSNPVPDRDDRHGLRQVVNVPSTFFAGGEVPAHARGYPARSHSTADVQVVPALKRPPAQRANADGVFPVKEQDKNVRTRTRVHDPLPADFTPEPLSLPYYRCSIIEGFAPITKQNTRPKRV